VGKKFNLEVVTPDEIFFTGETEMLIVKTTEGDIGILYGHEPLVAPVKIGSLRVKQEDESFRLAACSTGFVTVTKEKVTIVTDSAEWIDEIDIERAERAKERAENRIRQGDSKEVDVARAKVALQRAINRIQLYNHEG